MAAFRYRLQLLLDQKEERKKSAEEELAKRRAEVAAARETLEDLKQRERDLVSQKETLRSRLLAPPVNGEEIRRRQDWLRTVAQQAESAKDDVFSQEIAVEECAEKVVEARGRLADCAREVEILKKHREKCERRFRREQERKEALEQEEIRISVTGYHLPKFEGGPQ